MLRNVLKPCQIDLTCLESVALPYTAVNTPSLFSWLFEVDLLSTFDLIIFRKALVGDNDN